VAYKIIAVSFVISDGGFLFHVNADVCGIILVACL
jgi:hypothetical protein